MNKISEERIQALDELTRHLKMVDYNLSKQKIFGYDTLDEAPTNEVRIKSDLVVEIGGPSAHIKFGIRTRAEHTILKEAIIKILTTRKAVLTASLRGLCVRIVKEGGGE